MNHRLITLWWMFLTAGIALVIPLAAQAQPVPEDFDGMPWSTIPGFGSPLPPSRDIEMRWPGAGLAGPVDRIPPLPMLRSLSLTEAQSDEIFLILHVHALSQWKNARVAKYAQVDLQRLALSTEYDKVRASTLADSAARALGALALLRAECEHQIYALLTEEQRQQLEVIQRPGRRP
jgi:Spy/CpxP family protein refolding chaperone